MPRRLLLGVIALAFCAGAAEARTQRTFAYAPSPNEDAVSIWQVEAGGAALRAAGAVRHPIGTRAPIEVVLQPSGAHAYVVHAPRADVGAAITLHRVDARTGRLEFRSQLLDAAGTLALALDATGRHAYVVDASRALLRTFTVDQNVGTWRECHAPMPTGRGPCQVLLDPLGTFLFVLNRESCSVSRYRLDAECRPEPAGEDVLLNGSQPVRALVDPSGGRFYVSLDTYNVLLSMSIDARDGGLRTINAAGTGAGPSGLALNASGSRLFVAERGSDALSAFDIDPNSGELGPRLGPFPAGFAPASVALAADGRTLWVTGSSSELCSFVLDGSTAAVPGPQRRTTGPLGPLVGLAQQVTSDVARVALELRADGTLCARAEARGQAVAPGRDPLAGAALAAQQVVDAIEPCDELLVDPLGTWILALGRRPGRCSLVTVDSGGRLGTASEPVLIGPEVAAAAVAPGGCLVAIATRTPASVHIFSVTVGAATVGSTPAGALQHLHTLPLTAAPDTLVFDATGRALYLTHTAADRLTAVAVDEAGYMGRATSVALTGGPGPLALAPGGDVLYVGLRQAPGIVPCDVGVRSRELAPRTGLALELPLSPERLELAPLGEALLATLAGVDQPVRIDWHPATGALSLRAGTPGLRAGDGAREACATRGVERGAAVRATAWIEVAAPMAQGPEPRGSDREPRAPVGAQLAAEAAATHKPRE